MNELDTPMSVEFDKVLPAYMAAQKQMTNPKKNKTNTYCDSEYVDLQGLLKVVTPQLAEHDLCILQPIIHIDGKEYLLTRIFHPSGQWIGSACELDPDRNGIQAYGSEITYLRRYQLMAICGLAPADDDGNTAQVASDRNAGKGPRRQKQPQGEGKPSVDWDKRIQELETALKPFPNLRDQLAHHLNVTKGAGGEGFAMISKKPQLFDSFMRRAAKAQQEGKDIEQKENQNVA